MTAETRPAEIRRTVETRIPVTHLGQGIRLSDGSNLLAEEVTVTYCHAERWIDGRRQTKTRTKWTMTATTALLPGLPGKTVTITSDQLKAVDGTDCSPDWLKALIKQHRPF